MKKNKMMRTASVLLVLTLLTVCVISGTFAKYTTTADGTDTARVAKWGFESSSVELNDLFSKTYKGAADGAGNTVVSEDDVIAPGTSGSGSFNFVYGGSAEATAPEVDYNFTVSTDGSSIDNAIKNNANIQWKLDNGAWVTWDQLIASIEALSGSTNGSKAYKAGELPAAFNATSGSHTVSWQWVYSTDATADGKDTGMGNATDLADVTLKITLNATQID